MMFITFLSVTETLEVKKLVKFSILDFILDFCVIRGKHFCHKIQTSMHSRFSQTHKVGNVGIITYFVFPYNRNFLLYWWLVRITLVVDLRFLPQNFGPMVGIYEGLLLLCECRWGGDHICRWWGHLTTICCH